MRLPRLPKREVIGAPDCPLMHRWTLLGDEQRGKVMVHHFLSNTTDPDTHDHPWPFWTLVLWGRYDDLIACPGCITSDECVCGGTYRVVNEVMKRGMLRRRTARHAHATRTHEQGAWTIVVTGRKVRDWGFWREDKWWPFKDYERIFGFVMRCEDRETKR